MRKWEIITQCVALMYIFSTITFAIIGPDEKENLTIATFNIQTFGQSKNSKEYVMENLTEIVTKYDVIAIQEIKDIEQNVPYEFLERINEHTDKTYGMLLSQRTGLQEDDFGGQEQYAIYYDTAKVYPIGEGSLFEDTEDQFQREPYTARFSTINDDFSFVVQVIHTKPTEAVQEIDSLHDVFEWSKIKYENEDNFIMLGDFNADCSYASPYELEEMEIRSGEYNWVVSDDANTNLAESSCAYDRIVTTKNMDEYYTGDWDVDNSFDDNSISDHWPVWFELEY